MTTNPASSFKRPGSMLNKNFPFLILDYFGNSENSDYLHTHNCIEVCHIKSGSGMYSVNGSNIAFESGDVFVFSGEEVILANNSTDLILKVFMFEPGLLSSSIQDVLEVEYLKPFWEAGTGYENKLDKSNKYFESITLLLLEVESEYTYRNAGFTLMIKALIIKLSSLLIRYAGLHEKSIREKEQKNRNKKLEPVLEYINLNYHKQIKLNELADLVNLSISNFSLAFKRAFGISPIEYLIRMRVSKAAELLAKSDMKVINVALSCGFQNIANFITNFKKYTGLLPVNVKSGAGNGSPEDINIAYFGRWDKSDSASYSCFWSGSYLKVNFTGTTVKIKLGGHSKVYAIIDSTKEMYFNITDDVYNLTPTPLAPGTHTLLVAFNEIGDVAQFQGLILDFGAKTHPPRLGSKIIEYVGDSITSGYKLSKEAVSSFAWLSAEMLGYEHIQIAQKGICLHDMHPDIMQDSKPNMSKLYFMLQSSNQAASQEWNFLNYQVDSIVLNIGMNDFYAGVPEDTFQITYKTFLHTLRKRHPNAAILAVTPFNGCYTRCIAAAVNDRQKEGDENVNCVNTSDWLDMDDYNEDDSIHPSDVGNLKIAKMLAPAIASYGSKPPMGKTIYIKSKRNDYYITVNNSIAAAPLQANAKMITETETFDVIDSGNGYIAFKSHANGKYISARISDANAPLQARADSIGEWEQFIWVDQEFGYFALISKANGKFVTTWLHDSTVPLRAWADYSLAWEKYIWGEISQIDNA